MRNLLLSVLFRLIRPHFRWHFREAYGQEIMVIEEYWLCFKIDSMERCIEPGSRQQWELTNFIMQELLQ